MAKHTISFAKLSSPPSATAWAQTYHAGNVYTVVSVTQTEPSPGHPEHAIPSVHVLGKDIINNLEAEYFAIATKNLETIKEAVVNACKEIPENASATIIFSVIQDNVLLLFLYGNGHVFIKRGEKFGKLLQVPKAMIEKREVVAISGPIQPSDVIVLATDELSQAISQDTLAKELESTPAEAADTLAQKVDDEKYAGAAAIIFAVDPQNVIASEAPQSKNIQEESAGVPHQDSVIPRNEEKAESEKHSRAPLMQTVEEKDEVSPKAPSSIAEDSADKEEKMDLDEKPQFAFEKEESKEEEKTKQKHKLPKPSIRQAFFLILAVTLAGVLGTSILASQHKQQTTQAQSVFSSQFPSAKQKYDEGQSLLSLNKNLAMDDFSKAKTILEDLKTKVPADSPDAAQVTGLLDKVNQALGPVSDTPKTSLKQADASASKLLGAEIANPNAAYLSQDASSIYAADDSDISSIDSANKMKTVIKNSGDWTSIGGFGAYLGNFYLLDKKAGQILKFTKASDGFGKTNYFTDSITTLSQAAALTIDGSIWILSDDGSLKKFTKGKQDQFKLGKLDKPFSHPTKVITNVDSDNIYILDNGNNRVVVVKKDDGSIVNQYGAAELKNAKDIDFDEKNKKIYVLIDNKIFEIDM